MNFTITKYAQSCILIEKDGTRCLIDPGRYVEEMDGMSPADWPHIDLILVTHEHADHVDSALVRFLIDRDHCAVVTNASCAEVLKKDGIDAKALSPGAHHHETPFNVLGVAQTHGDLPSGDPKPEVVGFIVDHTFYTPGDSLVIPDMPHADVLFVPVAGPQMNLYTAREMIGMVKPKIAIPVHYANTAHYPIKIEDIKTLKVTGVEMRVLADKESIWMSVKM